MMNGNDDKPQTPIMFTASEKEENIKTSMVIQQTFFKSHPEITVGANNDLTKLVRKQSVLYSNLAIDFAVQYLAAMKKKGNA